MKPVRAWLAARTARERWLFTLAALAAVTLLIELHLLAPQRAERAALAAQIAAAHAQFDRLQSALPAAARQDAQRTDRLRARREAAGEAIRKAQVDLIAPRDMTEQLATILARHPQLRVVGIQSQPPQPLLSPENERTPAAPALYRHGLQVQVEGRYADLLNYVTALENTPRRLYWRALDLKVSPSGLPVTTLDCFTLSTESVWLRL